MPGIWNKFQLYILLSHYLRSRHPNLSVDKYEY